MRVARPSRVNVAVSTRYLAALVVLTASPRLARAEGGDPNVVNGTEPRRDDAQRAFSIGLSTSLRVPVGHERPFGESVYVPVALTLAGALSRHVRAGGLLELATTVGGRCSSSWCRAYDVRAAAELELRGGPLPATPWLLVGLGVHRLFGRHDGGEYVSDVSTSGPEAHVQAGFDFGKRTTIGPFVFAAADAYAAGGTFARDEPLAIHGWLGAGLRGALSL